MYNLKKTNSRLFLSFEGLILNDNRMEFLKKQKKI